MSFNFYCLMKRSCFWITLFSSCFLFFVVATEIVEYLPTAADVSVEGVDDGAVDGTITPVVDDSFTFKSSAGPQEKILPNYKKVKKLSDSNDDAVPSSNVLQTDIDRGDRDFLYVEQSAKVEGMSSATIAEATFNKTAEVANEETPGASEKQQSQQLSGHSVPTEEQLSTHFQNEEKEESLNPLQQDRVDDKKYQNGLPDITEIPTVTSAVHEFTELPQEVLEVKRVGVEALIIDGSVETRANAVEQQRINKTVQTVLPTANSEEIQKEEQIIKINDSGGDATNTIMPQILEKSAEGQPSADNVGSGKNLPDSLPATAANITGQQDPSAQFAETLSTLPPAGSAAEEAEEVPIPVFSEWAQKQMEAAEKQQQLEQDVVNTSTQRKHNNNNTNGSQKLPPLKLRAKNYASPDCGAKIIASNGDASNTGAVLSASKDEYMLSPCTNRIWFVVELCEAIQAQKIDLANFELFSSSPRNFTVAVSNRFPTREWSNVGRFIAEDSRTVQSFDLHPHLFGKFVRVDIHSHYSKEHFCPVSLFRVFGTSEFEAFETENQPNEDLDDFEDEFVLEQAHVKNSENNLFKSASDAVLSIVKKAAEALAKPASNNNSDPAAVYLPDECQTLVAGQISCVDCKKSLVERINEVLSCKARVLTDLLRSQRLKRDLLYSRTCANNFGIELIAPLNEPPSDHSAKELSYFLYLLPIEYVGALCQLLVESQRNLLQPAVVVVRHQTPQSSNEGGEDAELALNLTIDQKLSHADDDDDATFEGAENVRKQKKKLIKADEQHNDGSIKFGAAQQAQGKAHVNSSEKPATPTTTVETNSAQAEQLARPQIELEVSAAAAATAKQPLETTTPTTTTTTIPPTGTIESVVEAQHEDAAARDVNIFNVNIDDDDDDDVPPAAVTPQPEIEEKEALGGGGGGGVHQPLYEGSADFSHSSITSSEQLSASVGTTSTAEDPSSWDSIDNLLSATTMMPPPPPGVGVATTTAAAAAAAGGGASSQQAASAGTTTTGTGTAGVVGVGVNMQQRIPNGGPHTESIFIRLSNRIKALELNMSLSGQYLEELSRRYKKQVEELQHTLTQQTLNVRTLEEQNRKHGEYEQLLSQHNLQLKNELEELTLQVHACIVVIIFVGAFVFLVIMVGILLIRSMRRETRELLLLQRKGSAATKRQKATTADTAAAEVQRKLNRRKSFEDFSDHQQSRLHKAGDNEKLRRPSEEAMLIIKKCGGDTSGAAGGYSGARKEHVGDTGQDLKGRQRKLSICYGSSYQKNAIVSNVEMNGGIGMKQSMTNSEETEEHLERALQALEEFDKFSEIDSPSRDRSLNDAQKLKIKQLQNGGGGAAAALNDSSLDGQKSKLSKKRLLNVKRQISAPGNMNNRDYLRIPKAGSCEISAAPCIMGNNSDYDDSLLLDEDDLDNFLPGADLAYNEFMPEGPSGYQILTTATTPTTSAPAGPIVNNHHNHKADKSSLPTTKKSGRRLSSPAFFKSPFSKSLKLKSNTASTSASTPSHESTSWEWYRSKKTEKLSSIAAVAAAKANATTTTAAASTSVSDARKVTNPLLRSSTSDNCYQQQQQQQQRRTSPVASLDSCSLSEINFPTNSNENSFRILEEAILSSTSGTTLHANSSNGNGGGGSSSSGGNSSIRSTSTSSSAKKKKSRSFNKIFKKVF